MVTRVLKLPPCGIEFALIEDNELWSCSFSSEEDVYDHRTVDIRRFHHDNHARFDQSS
jgi:hypothetical protein